MSKVEQQSQAQESTLKRLTIHTDDAGKAVVRRAITLRLAMHGETCSSGSSLHGAALVGLQAATLVRSKQLIASEQRRAWDLLRVRVHPVPVLVTGAGKNSRIEEEKTLCRAAH